MRQTTAGGNEGEHKEERASVEGWVGVKTEAFRLPGERELEILDALPHTNTR